MTAFTYNAGSNGSGGWPQPGVSSAVAVQDPLAANGLVEFGGIRVHDGTFVLDALGGVSETPEVRVTETDRAQDHGIFAAGSFYRGRTITVEGYVLTDYLDQLWPATDLLRKASALPERATYTRMELLLPGWTERRFCMVRPSAPLTLAPRTRSEARSPMREFQATFLAPDPRLYGVTLHHATGSDFGTTVQQVNSGNFPSPGRWVVNGPAESPELIDDARGRAIRYVGSVPTGSILVVDTLERTALLNGGNVYKNLSRFDDMSVPPGGLGYRGVTAATNFGGKWRYDHRDVWV